MGNKKQLEKIIAKLQSTDYIDVTIERPIGFLQKKDWDPVQPSYWDPYPFNYGFIDIMNPADKENFDAIVLNFLKLEIGQKIKGKIVGMMLRDDLDYKLIVIKDGTQVSAHDLSIIYDFYSPWFSGVKIEIWENQII